MPTMGERLRASGFDTRRDRPPIENYNPDDPAYQALSDDEKMALEFSRTETGQRIIQRLKDAAAARARAAVVVARFHRQVMRRLKNGQA